MRTHATFARTFAVALTTLAVGACGDATPPVAPVVPSAPSLAKGGPNALPTNGRLYFTSDFAGPSEVYSMNPDGSDRRRLTYTSDADGWLDVSPDGKKLVIAGSVSFLQGHLYTMNVDGTNRRLLVSLTNSVVADPAWSPDGRTIAYVAGAETPNVVAIWTVAASGGKVTRLSQATQSAAWPSWSPDGAKIVYVGYTPGTSDRDLYTMNADGSAPQLLHDCIEICVNPVWSADGRRVVYATVSGGVAQVQYCVVQLAVPTCGIPLATDVSTL